MTAPHQRSGLNGLVPFVLGAAGWVTVKAKFSKVVVPRNGMLKVATSNGPEPPAVDTLVGVSVRSLLAVPTVAPEPLAVPRTRRQRRY
jgi:hypothetical protein